jgi:hypothetical protein
MIKPTQIFGWEHEPVAERPSEFMPSRFSGGSEFSSLGAFDPTVSAAAQAARKRPLMAPQAMRSAPTDSDRTLSRLVPRWLEMLPPESRPDYLCAHFPRIANRLALCWLDPALSVQLLDDFLRDKRGARRGFPPEALAELKRLRQIATQRAA